MEDEKSFSVNESVRKNLFKTAGPSATDNVFLSGKLGSGNPAIKIPELNLPKGGGALKGIDEKFEINPANGTASFSIPLPITPGRNGFQPALSLPYNSGGGNSALGMGWGTSLQAIQRRTDKRLPRYRDNEESDVFLFSGAEDLQPLLEEQEGGWHPLVTRSGDYEVKAYRPRVEGGFSRIERISHPCKGSWWRVTTTSNIVTFYGADAASRIADPGNPDKIFKWLPSFSYTDKGDWIQFRYREEDLVNVPDLPAERNRLRGKTRFANTYLKQINYGNRVPYYRGETQSPYDPCFAPEGGHFFELVLDYGDEGGNGWECRKDPFSDYHAGFDIRTYRLCRSIKMYHLFEELGEEPCLVSSFRLVYQNHLNDAPDQPTEFSYLKSITQTGYVRHQGKYLSKSLPPMEFGYQELRWNTRIETITPENTANAPAGISSNYQWADPFSEGISGILTEQGDAWYYKYNQGGGSFSPATSIAPKPSFTGLSQGTLQLTDLEGDGSRQIVSLQRGSAGYFPMLDNNEWDNFRPFEVVTEIDLGDPFLRMIDLDGDGRADLLVTEESIFRWYPSLGKKGYAPLEIAGLELDEEQSPRIVFADPEQTIFLANMSGSGLTDIVRIRNGSVCYWPNLGYARFGPKVEMGDAPWFDTPDLFNPAYIYLADISGTGATDILYLGKETFRAWLNYSGNSWSKACVIDPFFPTALPDKLSVTDLLGNGTACIVWSSSLPNNAHAPMKYIDLMSGRKPHVMNFHTNNCGLETRLSYTSSSRYYLEDKKAGRPWVTRLPFPVLCVSKKEVWEKVTNTYLVNTYTYHHGYYDHAEREFRGFGRVDQLDTQLFEAGQTPGYSNYGESSLDEPPVLTRTWFHVGAYLQNKPLLDHFRHEYWYRNASLPPGHPETEENDFCLPGAHLIGRMSNQELREAHRACKGMVLRQEVFALDGSEKEALPYTVSEHNCHIKLLQPAASNRYAVFLVSESEAITFSYERSSTDPRIDHTLNIELDDLGHILKSAAVVYPRQHRPPELIHDTVWEAQHQLHATLNEHSYTGDVITRHAYRLRLPFEAKVFELSGIPRSNPKGAYRIADFNIPIEEIRYEDAFHPDIPQKKCVDRVKKIYLRNDLVTPLSGGEIDSLGLVYESYSLAATTGLLNRVFRRNREALISDIGQVMEEGGYTDLENNGFWWTRSGRMIYEQHADARAMFYLPRAFEDPFGARTTVHYYCENRPPSERYWLQVNRTTDALGNSLDVIRFNFRTLAPERLRDINLNISEALSDELGMVVATAISGKEQQGEGDRIDGTVRPFLTAEEIRSFFNAPFSDGDDPYEKGRLLLGNATSRQLYDYHQIPVRTASIVRETHVSEENGHPTKLQYSFEYSGGAGNIVLKKVQAPAGPAWGKDEEGVYRCLDHVHRRWIGSGRTVLNNKGKPVKQYEPYFSQSHLCEQEDLLVRHGVSPVLHYDPLGRVIRTELPDGTFTRSRFDNWWQEIWDANDTVLESRWYEERIAGTYDRNGKNPKFEQEAAKKAAVHAATPVTIYLDSLGRAVLSAAFNKWHGTREHDRGERHEHTSVNYDIKGNMLKVTDARGNVVMRYTYNLQNQTLIQHSMDAGKRWLLMNVLAKPLRIWDERNQEFQFFYDQVHRPTESKVTGGDGITPLAHIFDKIIYGESLLTGMRQGAERFNEVDLQALNILGKPIKRFDTGGVVETPEYDFKGLPPSTTRRLFRKYREVANWTGQDPDSDLEEEFKFSIQNDALGRIVSQAAPDLSVIIPSYNETGLLNGESITQVNPAVHTVHIKDIDYNEKGQRNKIIYGNDVITKFYYDPDTFRILRLKTQRKNNDPLQDWHYTYDPVGNITTIEDKSIPVVFFNNRKITGNSAYTYDAVYRLKEATGRENNAALVFGDCDNWNDQAYIHRMNPGDPMAMRNYCQFYQYDPVGNIREMRHVAPQGNWTRTYEYESDNNRLKSTRVGDIAAPVSSTRYHYHQQHGFLTELPHLEQVGWNFKEEVAATVRQRCGDDHTPATTYYQYDGSGQRLRKITEHQTDGNISPLVKEERFYILGYELYKKHDGVHAGLERVSLSLIDQGSRFVTMETRNQVDDGTEKRLVRYQLHNHQGSASIEIDGTKASKIISYEQYHPFGTTAYQANNKTIKAAAKRYRYTGMERDEETGLEYHTARYYMPWLGRWMNCDPDGIKDGVNLYAYARGNPIGMVDKKGTQADDTAKKALAPVASSAHAITEGAIWNPWVTGVISKAERTIRDTARGKILERFAGNVELGGLGRRLFGALGEFAKDADRVTATTVQQIKSSSSLGRIAQIARDATRDAARYIKNNPTVAGLQAEARILLRTGAPPDAVAAAETALQALKKPIQGAAAVAPKVTTGLPGVLGTGLKLLAPIGAVLSAYSLGESIAKGEPTEILRDAAGTVAGGLETFALASSALGAGASGTAATATVGGGATLAGGTAAGAAAAGGAVVGAFAVGVTIGIGLEKGLNVSEYASKHGTDTYEGLKSLGLNDTASLVAGGVVTVASIPLSITEAAVDKGVDAAKSLYHWATN